MGTREQQAVVSNDGAQLALYRGAAVAQAALRRLFEWWLGEARDLLPAHYTERLSQEQRCRLVLSLEGTMLSLALRSARQDVVATRNVALEGITSLTINDFISEQGLEPADVEMGLELPKERFFCRRLLLPSEAGAAVDEIAAQNLFNMMPFKEEDVYFDQEAVKSADVDKIEVWQWVVKRESVRETLNRLGLETERLAFLTAPAASRAALICLRKPRRPDRTWTQKIAVFLTCSAVVLALASGGLKYYRQHEKIDDLASALFLVKAKAQQISQRAKIVEGRQEALFALRRHRSGAYPLAEILEEVTRILPAHTWVTEFRLAEAQDGGVRRITLSGYSQAAPGLVGILDGSWMFRDTALTAPIAVDPVEQRERFSLQATVKPVAKGAQ